ncbi:MULTISPECIES: nuclear transport factor 2 family protein [Streptomyces]|uniref:nuclear transport factor 2 family protein n=1 Tax=Streptomyces TaxID=1883 RepID=UPI0015FB0871|nr:nuclear transport factor 2 family protein [Streptomyces sp. GMR22]MBA6436978.1 nuclear transport factor 2 family protein [Streptomyces sp. GMR22]
MTDTRTSRSPRDVLAQLLDDVSADRWEHLHELYADGTVVRHPFARDESRLLEGREALRLHFDHFAQSGLSLRARDVVWHDTTDPETVIAEFVYDGTGPAPDEHFEMAACFVWRVRDGLILDAHDYLDRPRPVAAPQHP